VAFRAVIAAISALAALLPATLAVHAQSPQVPIFWDAKERLPKPDLSALPRLRFLTTTDFPPFNFLDGSGRLSGFHVDLARAICAELGIADKCQIEAIPWAELEGALAKDEGEAIIAGLAATKETREKYVFSRPYLQFPARFIVPKAKSLTEPLYDRVQGRPVGVLAGSAHERMLHDYFGTVKVTPFAKPDELYADLKAGKIDAAFGDGMRLSFWLASEDAANCCRFAGGPYIAPEYLGTGLAIAAKADQPILAAAFDYALQEISEKGVFAELYLRYFPISFY
jgi:polar amino acid transport system substrate-binding protein